MLFLISGACEDLSITEGNFDVDQGWPKLARAGLRCDIRGRDHAIAQPSACRNMHKSLTDTFEQSLWHPISALHSPVLVFTMGCDSQLSASLISVLGINIDLVLHPASERPIATIRDKLLKAENDRYPRHLKSTEIRGKITAKLGLHGPCGGWYAETGT